MTEPLSGFRRWKAKTRTVPTPNEVDARLGVGNLSPPGTVSSGRRQASQLERAFSELDRLSVDMLPGPELNAKADRPARAALGLDQQTAPARLRASIARAWRVAWQYCDAYCDFKSDTDAAGPLSSVLLRELDALRPQLDDAASILDRWRLGPDSKPEVRTALRDLRELADTLGGWKEQFAVGWLRDAHRPDRFLILRLAEIYTLSFGRRVPLHITRREHRPGANVPPAPDQQFAQFLETSLLAIGWPDPATGKDDALRGLKEIPRINGQLDELCLLATDDASEARRGRVSQIEAGAFPSAGLMIDLDMNGSKGLLNLL